MPAQSYWQQRVKYVMEIDFDASKHQFTGKQSLTYTNNSPDTLDKVFYHLYFNAFQPGSMMDVRSQNLMDPDKRVGTRISKLGPDEIGYHNIQTLTQDGADLNYEVSGTVVEVTLDQPLLPGSSTLFEMTFDSQVPVQIRRSGRNNSEGIDYSMTQWFPKIAEYDENGWYPYPYIAREFYSPWGDYEVNITIDRSYVVAASGILTNPDEIGYKYSGNDMKPNSRGEKLTWKFKAENVHDFAWVADPDYTHTTVQVPDGPLIRFFYQEDSTTVNWKDLPEFASKSFQFASKYFGEYPYPEFIVMQGGDGGMEYPMSTLITGDRGIQSLVGVTVHEAMHSWYQGVLASNEILYGWMDEGFVEYTESKIMAHLFGGNHIINNYRGYFSIAKSGFEEPMSTHADYYGTNMAYGVAVYSKGAVAVNQLGYVIGEEALARGMKRYFNEWKFRHPDMYDFIRVMEKESGMVLDWYFQHWVFTTNKIDYSLASVEAMGNNTLIKLERKGRIPMPVDLTITKKDGSQQMVYIPLSIMRGEKPNESGMDRTVEKDWFWTHPEYELTVPVKLDDIESIEIDASYRMADINREDNSYKPEKGKN